MTDFCHNGRTLLTEGALSRGVLVAERIEDRAGDEVRGSVAGARQFRAFAGAAPADEARTLVLGRRRGSARRYYGLLPGAG